jgi:hypothetical protein
MQKYAETPANMMSFSVVYVMYHAILLIYMTEKNITFVADWFAWYPVASA